MLVKFVPFLVDNKVQICKNLKIDIFTLYEKSIFTNLHLITELFRPLF